MLNLEQAENYVAKSRNARWDNYTIVVFKANPRAYTNKAGVRHNGVWGFESRYDVTDAGEWAVPTRR